ncbi:MAG: macro domain-containing protein [Gammaproteobacteria bacterium]|nr:macro domain-containing protein [Gammaproteobacteria bacterium]
MRRIGATLVHVITGDLTRQDVDAIVNAANEHLAHGGGVAAAIVRAGGSPVQRESTAWVREHGPVAPGHATVTTAGAMPARHVIHVVGPRYRTGQDNEGMLRTAVEAALDAALEHGDRSIAFPAISAGIFGYPRAEATRVLADAVLTWVSAHPGALDKVCLVGYDDATAADFATGLERSGQESDE